MDGQYQVESGSELRGMLSNLAPGETLTLTDERGEPLAVVVSVHVEARPEPVTNSSAAPPERLNLIGERATEPGAKQTEVVSEARRKEVDDWLRRWDELAEKIDAAWQGNKSAVETLSEMRR